MRAWAALLAVAGVLTVTAPATAATVGDGQVVTDPATETEEPPGAAADDATRPVAAGATKQSRSSGPLAAATTTPHTAPAATASPAPVAQAAPTTVAPAGATSRTLPFTGVNAGVLAAIGAALLAAGSGLLAVLRKPVE